MDSPGALPLSSDTFSSSFMNEDLTSVELKKQPLHSTKPDVGSHKALEGLGAAPSQEIL